MLITELNIWKKLEKSAQFFRDSAYLRKQNTNFIVNTPEIELNYNQQKLDSTTLGLLFELANELYLQDYIEALFKGDIVNQSERKPALHTALRTFNHEPLKVNDIDVMPQIQATREKINVIAGQIRTQQWLGYSGKPIKDIVNIGIGGSDFGPRFCLKALSAYTSPLLNYHFISDADFKLFDQAVARLNPETTLFIISSKSFTTPETLYNAKKALAWLGHPKYYDQHVIAVTAKPQHAKALGFNHVLPIWDWIGGRYSSCSAINLITAIAIGPEHFNELLYGANHLDQHFQYSKFEENLPVILALIGIWNNNFLHIHNLLTLVYSNSLENLIPFIQQVEMESNGKSIDNLGQPVPYATGPIIWGGAGNQAQHSYYQLLCQGTHRIAVDFVSIKQDNHELINKICYTNQQMLIKNVSHYTDRLTPFNDLSLTDCSPRTIGALIALYEHKVFAQACIWNINPFDQPGIEAVKRETISSLDE